MEPRAALLLAAQIVGVLALAGGLTYVLRRPRLALDVALRRGTREGKLYVVVLNRGGFSARGTSLAVWWTRPSGERSRRHTRELGVVHPADPVRVEITALQTLIADEGAGWSGIVVQVRAKNALPRRARIPVAERAPSAAGAAGGSYAAPEPVRYASARTLRCPDSPDGQHLFERRPYVNDGVMEHWHVCRRCRHVEREPLAPEEERVQAQRRKERLDRERRRIEEELARAERERGSAPPPPRAGKGAWRRFREEERELARDVDTFPPEVAFYVLELDPAKAAWEDVLVAHRRLALAHHPDRKPGIDADTRAILEQKMQEINRARDRLREHFGLRTPME